MANVATKDGIYVVRFRFQGKEHKRSLKTRSQRDASIAQKLVELTIHRLLTGQLAVPPGVDAGDFIVCAAHRKKRAAAGSHGRKTPAASRQQRCSADIVWLVGRRHRCSRGDRAE